MKLTSLDDVYRRSNRVTLYLRHFAKGYYPTLDHAGKLLSMNVNRLFFVLENRNGTRCRIGDESGERVLRAGDVFFAPIGHPSVFCLDEDLHFVSVHFCIEIVPGIDLFSGIHRIWHAEKPELAKKVSAFFDDADSPLLPLKLKQVVYEIIVEVLSDLRIDSFEETARFAPYRKLLEWIDAHCAAKTRIAQFAAVMNMSRTAFVRKFAKDTGISPKHFFDRRLTARASRQLTHPGKSIEEVSDSLKFSSKYVFSRYFKKQTGMTPGEFRRRNYFTV